MIRLQRSEALQAEIRQDDVAELAIPTWTLVREAIQAGRSNDALRFMDYALTEDIHDAQVLLVDMLITHIATSLGEEEVAKLFRQFFYPSKSGWLSTTPGVEESLQRCAQSHRSHQSNFTVAEEPDRYVMRCDPCGSGGRLRRTKSVATTKKAYPWSWSKSGVPYFCTHCCIGWEIIPIELRGYPIRISLPGDRPEDPCILLFYKKPELIPEEYFTRVGMTPRRVK